MQPLPYATTPLLDTLASSPDPTGRTDLIAHTFDTFGFMVAIIGLAIPMIFHIVWIVVGVEVLIYLRRRLKGI